LYQSVIKRWSEAARYIAYSFVLIFFLLLFSDVPKSTALGGALLFLVQCLMGSFVLACFRSGKNSFFQLFGSSFAIGSVLFTMFSIVGRQLQTHQFKYLALILLIVTTYAIFKFRNKPFEANYSSEQLIAILFPVLIVLSFQFSWYIGPSLLITLILHKRFGGDNGTKNPRPLVALFIFSSGLLLFIILRTKYWWITSDDYQFFEVISNSIWNWGLNENAAAVGGNVYNWHFLTYAWSGSMDGILHANTWVILTRCTPILSVISTISLLFEISTKLLPGLLMRSRLVGIVITSLLAEISWNSPSYGVSLIWFLATLLFLIEISSSTNKVRLSILAGVFLGVTALGKVSSIPVLILFLLSLWLFNLIKHNRLHQFYLISGISGIISLLIIYLLSYRHSTAANVLWFIPFDQVVHNLWSGTHIGSDFQKASQSFFHILLLPILASVLLSNFQNPKLHIVRIWTNISIIILILPTIFLAGWVDTVKYITSPAHFSLTVILGLYVSTNNQTVDFLWRRIPNIAAFLLLLLPVLIFRDKVFPENIAIQLTHIFLWLALVLFIIRNRLNFRSTVTTHWLSLIPVLILVFLSFVEPLAHDIEGRIASRGSQQNVETIVGDQFVEEIGNWLKNNSDRNSIIASNSFCGGNECMGQFWFSQQLQLFRSEPDVLSGSCSRCNIASLFGGANFLLADYSDRRFLIQGPRFLFGLSYPPNWVIEKMDFSLSLPALSDDQKMIKMETFGVDYFVIDKIASPMRTYISPNLIVFQNLKFIIIKRPA
jgi:hypothetical protein